MGLHCGSVLTYVLACLLAVNFKCTFKYSPKIERPCALGGNAGLLPECSVGNRSRDGSSLTPTVHYLFVTAMDPPSTVAYSQTVQDYTCGLEIRHQVRVVHKCHS